MEKILLSNNKVLEIYGISNTGNVLAVQFRDTDIVELEETFSDQRALKKIILQDAGGEARSVFKNYSILRTLSKQKKVIINELTEETADIITVSLEQKPEWMVAQEVLAESYDAAIIDLGEAVGSINVKDIVKGDGE